MQTQTPSRLRRRAVASAVVLALTVTGCGSNSHSGGDAGGPAALGAASQAVKPAQTAEAASFIKKADTICKKLDNVLDIVLPKSNSLHEVANLAPGRAELEQRAVTKLRHLRVPAGLSAPWHEMLQLRATLARELVAYGRAAAKRDKATLTALTKSKARVHQRLARVGHAAGFNECSEVR
jgi:hypothetical protein